ncbi:MAG: MFS transporter [Deltaproteobacteria bacterium]|nr:MFS transporter [Deltaproteobacteria bacterium]
MSKLRVLISLSMGHLVSHWYIGVLMLVLPLIKRDFALSFTEVGLIISFRSLAGAIGNTASGLVVDLVGKPHLILTISAAGMALCWSSVGFIQVYPFLLFLIPLATLFSNLWHSPSMSLLSTAYPERKGLALGLHGAAANLGQSLSPLLVGLVISYIGWRSTLKAHIIPGVALAVFILLFLRWPGTAQFKKKPMGAFLEMVKHHLLKNRPLFFISLVSGFRTMGQRCIETYLALFLAHKIGLDMVWVGFYLSILTFSSTFPEPLIGWLSDRVGRRSILWISLMLSGLSVIAIISVPHGPLLIACVALLGFFHYSLRPIIFAFALDVTPPEIGATTVSYVFTWNQAISALSPLVGGFLADAFGIQYALYFVAFLSLSSAFLAITVRYGREGVGVATP